jgi:hypothetical protein
MPREVWDLRPVGALQRIGVAHNWRPVEPPDRATGYTWEPRTWIATVWSSGSIQRQFWDFATNSRDRFYLSERVAVNHTIEVGADFIERSPRGALGSRRRNRRYYRVIAIGLTELVLERITVGQINSEPEHDDYSEQAEAAMAASLAGQGCTCVEGEDLGLCAFLGPVYHCQVCHEDNCDDMEWTPLEDPRGANPEWLPARATEPEPPRAMNPEAIVCAAEALLALTHDERKAAFRLVLEIEGKKDDAADS